MISRLVNLYRLICIVRERGNWKLMRRCRNQLQDFLLCRSGMNKRSIFLAIPYWWYMLKGLEVLVWRLETFGFLYVSGLDEETRQRLNRYI